MTFALTKAEFSGVDMAGVSRRRGYQRATLHITAAATDVDLDLGDDSGTFWTAAVADATYGELATKALEILQKIADNAYNFLGVKSQQLVDRDQVNRQILALDSAASAGGSATETLTVTGLLTTDTILGATIVEDGANPAYIQEAAKTCAVADQYVVTFSADPGAGAEVRVLVSRATGSTPQGGQYKIDIQDNRPNITLAASDGETTWKLDLEWILNDGVYPTVAIYGNA